jgi:NADH-quinone oxidoreductase subunit J
MELFVFICASVMILGGAIGVVTRSHPVHAALSLILTLFGVAVLFVAQNAHFLAAVQVIVYAGAIVVLFLFVIMLLGVDRAEQLRIDPVKVQRPLAAIVGVGLIAIIGAAILQSRDTIKPRGTGISVADVDGHDANVKQIAEDLFSNHVFAFELTSVLLVIAVVGTVLLARRPGKSGAGGGRDDVAADASAADKAGVT